MIEVGFGNPAAFAHTVIDWYALATGDLLYGAGEISRDSYNLAFSSAVLARSACEYAGIGLWLAELDIGVERRIARTARLVDSGVRKARELLLPGELDEYLRDNDELARWAQRNISAREKLAIPTARFEAANPAHGKANYAYLSMLAHGNVTAVAPVVQAQLTDRDLQLPDFWWRILLTCGHALSFASRVSELRDKRVPELMAAAHLFQHYNATREAFLASAES